MKNIYLIAVVLIVIVGAGLAILLSDSGDMASTKEAAYEVKPYQEIVNPSGFVNTNDEAIQIADYVGKRVIMLDIMTYSCINCQRTFPYVTGWYEKYKDDGLIVIGIHTPEFAFEKDKANVEAAMERFGITFPVVLDNEYGTWNALGNRFWPRKYLIDISGNVVYDHIGEGDYEETEMKIQELLIERAKVLGEEVTFDTSLVAAGFVDTKTKSRSPETYVGAARNEYLGNGESGKKGVQTFEVSDEVALNKFYLGGTWNLNTQAAVSDADATLTYRYYGKEVYLVASAAADVQIEVWQDGVLVSEMAGEDVNDGSFTVNESRLYKLINNAEAGEHVLELKVKGKGAELFAFTFG